MTTAPRFQITPGLLDRFRAYHADNIVWGSLHAVLEDWNLADEHIKWCVRWAHERGDTEGVMLGAVLLGLTKTQRGKVAVLA